MATNTEKYPIIQLLDNLNNPVSPATQVDSIYEDPGTKNPLDLIYKYESKNLTIANLKTDGGTDGGQVIKQIDTQTSNESGDAPDSSTMATRELYIVTDAWVGDGPNDSSIYNVDNTLHVRKYSASELLGWWFENDYLSKQAGSKIYCGTCADNSSLIIIRGSGIDNSSNSFTDLPHISGGCGNWRFGHTVDSNDALSPCHPIYKVVDFNSTNFFSPDLYPRRGVINPSGEYIWIFIDNPNVSGVKLYGFSGEDSPQEIDITPVENRANAWVSTGKFGIDPYFNSGDIGSADRGGDGLDYHIFVKYKENAQ